MIYHVGSFTHTCTYMHAPAHTRLVFHKDLLLLIISEILLLKAKLAPAELLFTWLSEAELISCFSSLVKERKKQTIKNL